MYNAYKGQRKAQGRKRSFFGVGLDHEGKEKFLS